MKITQRNFLARLFAATMSWSVLAPQSYAQTAPDCRPAAKGLLTQSTLTAITDALRHLQTTLDHTGLFDVPSDRFAFYDLMITRYAQANLVNLGGDQSLRQEGYYEELDDSFMFIDEPEICASIFGRGPSVNKECKFDEIWKLETFSLARRLFPEGAGIQELEAMTDQQLHLTLMGYASYVGFIANIFPGFAQSVNLPGAVEDALNIIHRERENLEMLPFSCAPDSPEQKAPAGEKRAPSALGRSLVSLPAPSRS